MLARLIADRSLPPHFVHEHLQKCMSTRDLASLRHAHCIIISHDPRSSLVPYHRIIRLFASLGRLLEASLAFAKVPDPCVLTWHAIISAFTINGESDRALALYHRMCAESIQPNPFMFPTVVKACADLRDTEYGMVIHGTITQYGYESDVFVGSSLIDMYVKCQYLSEGQNVFDKLPRKNAVSWAAMIDGYVQHNESLVALNLFQRMCREGSEPDKVVFLCIVKACGSLRAIYEGMLIHDKIIRAGVDVDNVLGNALVDMYAKYSDLDGAQRLFDELHNRNVISWGAMITGYAQNEQGILALQLYERMEREGLKPNEIILPCILKVCGNLGRLDQGEKIHQKMLEWQIRYDVVIGSTLVDMYAKCGRMEEAHRVFNDMPTHNVVSWSAIINGYVEEGKGFQAMELFKKMQEEGTKPDKVMFIGILKACGSVGAIEQGMLVHGQIIESTDVDVIIAGALVDMYAKCGNTEDARDSLEKTPNKNVVLWGALIAGYARFGEWKIALQCLKGMQRERIDSNGIVCSAILSACSHAGEIAEAYDKYNTMTLDHSVFTDLQHFTCMVDLLCSSGQLKEAMQMLQSVPVTPNITVWTSLMTACRTFGNVNLGKRCLDHVTVLDPSDTDVGMLSNLYADAFMWLDVTEVQECQF